MGAVKNKRRFSVSKEAAVKESAAFSKSPSVMKLGMYLKRVFNQFGGVNGPRDVKGVQPSVAEVMELNDIYNSLIRDHAEASEITTMSDSIMWILKGFGFNVVQTPSGWMLAESFNQLDCIMEAASVYSAKLYQFLEGQPDDVVKWVKKVLNSIFIGIREDFDGYREGKRPTIKSYGTHKIFKMTVQAVSDVKKDSSDVRGKWNFHDPVKDYCAGLGKILDKKIDGSSYQCVFYNHKIDLDSLHSWTEHDKATSQADYPMVGCYSTGIGGSYKNLSKEIPGTTYSIIVSVPLPEDDRNEFSNQFMTKSGDTSYSFSNNHHSKADGKDSFTVEYGMSDGEFVIREFTEGSADRFTVIYIGRNHMKAFRELVDKFNADTSVDAVEKILSDNGLRVKHSWWFNPYTD